MAIDPLTLFSTRYSSEKHIYHMNTFCIENAKAFNMKAGGTYSYHCVLKGYRLSAYTHVVPVYAVCWLVGKYSLTF